MHKSKPPEMCENIADIRAEIDSLDLQVIEILARRMRYVKAAAAFKPDERSIPAPDRVARMLEDRRRWAAEYDLPADAIGTFFEQLIQWFIGQQVVHWRTSHGTTSHGTRPEGGR